MVGDITPTEAQQQFEGAEKRSEARLRHEQSLRVHKDWLSSLDFRVNNEALTPEQRNNLIAFALLRRERRLEKEQGRTEEERVKNEFDPMTSLYRQEHLRPAIEKCIAEGKPFALLFTDLDHFGEINKRYGQTSGDEVIAEAALRLTEGLREESESGRSEDRVYRNGGDESAILISGITSLDQLKTIAERVRVSMEFAPFHLPMKNELLQLTVSVGGAIWEGEDMKNFMEKASDQLVEAKKQRNIVSI